MTKFAKDYFKRNKKEQCVNLLTLSRSEIEVHLGRKLTNQQWKKAHIIGDYLDWNNLDQDLAAAIKEWSEKDED